MLKKVLIGVGVILLIGVGFIAYSLLTTKKHSPQDVAEITQADLSIKVVYCQPYKKGRTIFGDENTDALIPNGKYWRLGANDATEITFSEDVIFAGESVAAGSYRMYAVPNADSWEVSLNSALGEWGAFEPDYSLDVIKVNVPIQANSEEKEQLTITLASGSKGVQMNMMWDKVLVSVPITE
jgi:hypothetical protein